MMPRVLTLVLAVGFPASTPARFRSELPTPVVKGG
jgi:hypothetical protein